MHTQKEMHRKELKSWDENMQHDSEEAQSCFNKKKMTSKKECPPPHDNNKKTDL